MQAGVMLRRGIHMPSWALYGYEQTTQADKEPAVGQVWPASGLPPRG